MKYIIRHRIFYVQEQEFEIEAENIDDARQQLNDFDGDNPDNNPKGLASGLNVDHEVNELCDKSGENILGREEWH